MYREDNRTDQAITVIKEVMLFVAFMALVAALYDMKFLASLGYLSVALLLWHEQKIRKWLRERRRRR
jgi:hypothetical protein